MKLIKPSFEILTCLNERDIVEGIERIGRTCYKSEDKITQGSAEKFVKRIIDSGHHSVIEHFNISVRFICDRGVTHELVRHRLAAYSQESTRYCNYRSGVTFVIPPWVSIEEGDYSNKSIVNKGENDISDWVLALMSSEKYYISLLRTGWSPQMARSVLPNSLKTEIVMTANLREWRHVLNLRTSNAAHPQIREIMVPLLEKFKVIMPIIFNSIGG